MASAQHEGSVGAGLKPARTRLRIVPYRPWHLDRLALQVSQAVSAPLVDKPEHRAALAVPHQAFTCFWGKRPVGSAGLLPYGPRRAVAWALVGGAAPWRAWKEATEASRAVIAHAHANGVRRIEAEVLLSFPPAHQWMMMLGFEPEGLVMAADTAGQAHIRYAHIEPPAPMGLRARSVFSMLQEILVGDEAARAWSASVGEAA